MAREVAGVLARQAELAASGAKAVFGDDGLEAVFGAWFRRLLTATHVGVQDALGVSFDLTDDLVRAYLADAAANVAGIEETTRAAVRDALRAGHSAGESMDQIAKRIRALPAFSATRARTIARTEIGQATNLAALVSYRASGLVVGVRVLDGDGCGLSSHDDPRPANGTVLTLEAAASVPRLAHPRCVRAFAPVVDPAEMQDVA
jgi:hypothetical protein